MLGINAISFADIKGFLSDVKPALLSTLDAEYEKNPFEVEFRLSIAFTITLSLSPVGVLNF